MSGHGYLGKTSTILEDMVDARIRNEREDMWGEMPGEIVSFDAKTQTATVRPLYKKRLNGVPTQVVDLEEVPVRFPRIGGFVITSRIKKGDRVTLRPQMRDTSNFHDDDGAYQTGDSRSFSLSDYEAFLDGGESLTKPIGDFNVDEMEMRSEDGSMKVQIGDDRIRLFSDDGKLRFVVKPGRYVQMKAGDDMHFTLDLKNGRFVKSPHPMVEGDDPNPQD